jgi:hypothetical protein
LKYLFILVLRSQSYHPAREGGVAQPRLSICC